MLRAISGTSDIPLALRDKFLLRLSDDLRDGLDTISNSQRTNDTAYFTLSLDEATDVLVLREGPNSNYALNTLEVCLSHDVKSPDQHVYQGTNIMHSVHHRCSVGVWSVFMSSE